MQSANSTVIPVTKTRQFFSFLEVTVIWWPAVVLTLFSYAQFANFHIFRPFARGIGLSHYRELSLPDTLHIYTKTLLTTGVLLPVISVLLAYLLGKKWSVKITLVGALLLALLSFINLMGVANTGSLMTWELLRDSAITASKEPELAREYVSISSLVNLTVILAAIVIAGLITYFSLIERLPAWIRKIAYISIIAGLAVQPLLYAYDKITFKHEIDPAINFVHQQIIRLLKLNNSNIRIFDDKSIEQSITFFQQSNHADKKNTSPFFAKEADSNLLIISLETAPKSIISLDEDSRFTGLRTLSKKAFTSNQHFSTYPYTSDALFSMFSSLYPNYLRRDILKEDVLKQENNLDQGKLGLFHSLKKHGYDTTVYLPLESLFTEDREMFYLFGANHVYVPKKSLKDEAPWPQQVTAITSKISGYKNISPVQKQAFEKKLAFDLISMEKMLADIKEKARTGEKFSYVYLPLIGHGPWPNLMPDRSLMETGVDLFLIQDQWIQYITKTLKDIDALDNTIIIITADHGLRTTEELPTLKPGVLNDVSFRVPLIIYAPNALSRNIELPYLTSHIDIAPTILGLLGISDDYVLSVGSPIWNKHLSDRRSYFLANDYLGVDGYHEQGKFYFYQAMTNSVSIGDSMHQEKTALKRLKNPDQIEDAKHHLQVQSAFQSKLKSYYLERAVENAN